MTQKEFRELRNYLSPLFVYFEFLEQHRNCVNNLPGKCEFKCEFEHLCDSSDILEKLANLNIDTTIPEIKKLFDKSHDKKED
jgi:hypothetical protein